MPRNLIIGDIHSEYGKLISALEKASYDPDSDRLYFLGDFCDRGKDAIRTLRFVMNLPNSRAVIGNHDTWLQDWLYTGDISNAWKRNGGKKTVDDIHYRHNLEKEERLKIADWLHSLPLVIIEDRYLITHGGPPHRRTLKDMEDYAKAERPRISSGNAYDKWDESCIWDRDYMLSAYSKSHSEVKDRIFMEAEPLDTGGRMIFVGHTPTLDNKPFFSKKYNLVALDTGAGHCGLLTVMDMDTLRYWQA